MTGSFQCGLSYLLFGLEPRCVAARTNRAHGLLWARSPVVALLCSAIRGAAGPLVANGGAPERLLLHTLAHVLIRELSAVAGYHEASIRKRICQTDMLLYTASAQSAGGPGGLARQGDQNRFGRLLRGALRRSTLLQGSPVPRMRSGGDEAQGSAGDAQRICLLCVHAVARDCYEAGNVDLDRKLLTDPEIGFFCACGDRRWRVDSTDIEDLLIGLREPQP